MKYASMTALLSCTTAAVLLAACTSPEPASGPASGKLQVHVGLFGGPARPDGGMADSNAPQPGAPVIVVSGSGRRWLAKTGQDGVASFSVPAGRYSVSSSFCGPVRRATVVPGKRAHVQVACAIP